MTLSTFATAMAVANRLPKPSSRCTAKTVPAREASGSAGSRRRGSM
ncbi:hypothetical protein [Azospirillum baldaniorum]|nr:hypothetical protein [Azospirillum baldaniorum]